MTTASHQRHGAEILTEVSCRFLQPQPELQLLLLQEPALTS